VARDRERLGQRAEAQVDVGWKAMQRESRDRPRSLQCARRIDPEELQVLADVTESAVGRRLAARVEGAHDDRVPDAEPRDVRADLGHRARHLVADHLRGVHARVHRPVRDVQVGPAHAAVRDVEAHLARAGGLGTAVSDGEGAAALVVHRGHRTII
jgi:hypothetical protein